MAVETDDRLDAWVAWRLGKGLLEGDVAIAGDARSGAYLVPRRASELLRVAEAEVEGEAVAVDYC